MPIGSWGLHHRVFRSTPTSTTDKSPQLYFQHVTGLGHHPDAAFLHTQGPDPAETPTTVAIPLSQMEPYSQLLNLKFGALWMYRMGSQVTGGASYSLGEFTVRLGELREKGGQNAYRGIIVCIQTTKPEPAADEDRDLLPGQIDPQDQLLVGQALVRDVWSSFSVAPSKEVITSRPLREGDEQTFDEVALWCEILRFQK